METTTLSTRDLAKLLDLNVSTVKRWADGGELPCMRTPGGHRRFCLEDVHGFLAKRGISPRSLAPIIDADEQEHRLEGAILHRHWQWLQDHLVALALDGQVRRVTRLFTAMYLAGIHPAELCDELVSPAMARIGHQWAINQLTIADEHLATHTIAASLAEMSTRWPAQHEVSFRALCGCIAPDMHELACLCLSQVLQFEGWQVSVIGANTPADALIAAAERLRPNLICVSATIIPDLVSFRTDLRRVAHVARGMDSVLAVGGSAVVSQDVACSDFAEVLRDMGALVEFARQQFILQPHPLPRAVFHPELPP